MRQKSPHELDQDLAKQLAKAHARVNRLIGRVTQEIAIEAFDRVVKRSPVDTSLFRTNWQVQAGTRPSGTISYRDGRPHGEEPSDAARLSALNQISKLLKQLMPVWIVNNLPYAGRLENGSSTQAPAGMVALTVHELQTIAPEVIKRVRMEVK